MTRTKTNTTVAKTKQETVVQQETVETTATKTFAQKVQDCITYLECLRIDTEISSKQDSIARISKKDGKTDEDFAKLESLDTEIKILQACQKVFIDKMGGTVALTQAKEDKFAFICAWTINPVKGAKHKDSNNNDVYDISFAGMNKPVSLLKAYYKHYLDNDASTTKQDAKKTLQNSLNDFVNQYMPQVEKGKVLTPCEDDVFTLTFAKFDKYTTELVTKTFKYPKNCMQDGYKPMKVSFVNTEEKPMIKELSTACFKGLKWDKSGINTSKIDDYKLVQQIFLQALRTRLDFDTTTASTTASKGIII